MADFKALLTKKKVFKTNITQFKTKLYTCVEQADSIELKLYEKKLRSFNDELSSIFQEILLLCADKDWDTYIQEQQTIQETLDELWITINRKCTKPKLSDSVNENVNVSVMNPNTFDVRLPTLQLCSFTGENIEEWISFYDLFKASVDSNPNISKCHKLQYLRASCKKKALSVIESLPVSDANYDIALRLLEERYSNKRELTNALIRKLFNLPNVADSAQAILHCVDVVNECVRSLRTLELEVSDLSDVLFVYLITEKLDRNIKFWWERTLKKDELGTLESLLEFLKDHARTIQNSKGNPRDVKRIYHSKVTSLVSNKTSCVFCKEEHSLHRCNRFLNLSVQMRIEFVKRHTLCFNCLSTEPHLVKNCRSVHKCRKCNLPHHTILHFDRNLKNSEKEKPSQISPLSPPADVFLPSGSDVSNHSTTCAGQFNFPKGEGKRVLLCTAVINVKDSSGRAIPCRALLDCGSEASFVSEECANRLSLYRQNTKIEVSCLGSYNAVTSGQVELNFSPHFESHLKFRSYAFVISKITSDVPHTSLPSNIADNFSDMVLADPEFYQRKPIDILLGVNVFFTILKGEIIRRGPSMPFAVRSQLGWIISGNTLVDDANPAATYTVNNLQLTTNELIERFWTLDSIPEVKRMSSEDQECEEFFKTTHQRDESGRYIVKLPFKESPLKLGNSKDLALKRFRSLEQRLLRSPHTYELYKQFMKEYLDLGHMEQVPNSESPRQSYYIPHHAVIKECSSTTKLRVVFNASSKSSSGISLNDILMVGPRIQQELFPVLVKFRNYPVVITADIMKMFRQVLIAEEDRDFQRIFWRDSPKEIIQEFRLKTVTYGTTSAPYLATRSLYQLANDEQNEYPLAAKAVLLNFFVDDCLAGALNSDECKELVNQLVLMLDRGGLLLRKWSSNDLSVLENIPKELRNDSESMKIHEDSSIKILGIYWNPREDYFNFSMSKLEEKSMYTKRDILSDLAKIFDPLGWLAPCIIYVKILIQDMWKLHLSWDEPVSDEVANKWKCFRRDLPLIQKLKIPRFVLIPDMNYFDICAFCDASEKGYCAVIYLRSVSRNLDIKVSLLTSKTRVAPLKVQSLPRLELCSASLLVDLVKSVLEHLEFPVRNVLAWTDSTVALSWISSEPYRWVPFVANRVAKIQTTVSNMKWNHIDGKLNPADTATRGLFPSDLLKCERWFLGPEWLSSPAFETYIEGEHFCVDRDAEAVRKEERKTCVSTACVMEETDIFKRYSSWSKLRRIVALCLRFIHNCRNSSSNRVSGFLTTEEIRSATKCIIKNVQQAYFPEELSCLKSSKEMKSVRSRIIQLSPFLDKDGIIRVGGRLKNANLPESSKHPILLPKEGHITKLIVTHYHISYLHASQELLISTLRMQFWILSVRHLARKIINGCLPCIRNRGKTMRQIMGDLPSPRVQPSRPFAVTGIDYAGPYLIKSQTGRGAKTFKCYISLFVCFSTKAVHLELVSDLTTSTFLAALKRFIARRGKPSEISSDCGTNFRGARKELKEIYKNAALIERSSEISSYIASEGIKWHLNPPSSPHFGGIWESNVKSMKFHLKRILGSTPLTYEEFLTVLTQVEACMNSRPLCAMSSDRNDLSVLTPGHFLIGAPLLSIPESDVSDVKSSRLKRWSLVQQTVQHFWKRWSSEYLTTLQQRSKWFRALPDIKCGDLVLIKNEQFPPNQWRIGRIIAIHPDSDNRVRVATVHTATGDFKRAIAKLCLIPNSASMNYMNNE